MDTFTDSRDGNIYKTVEINGQTWLAENLRYEGVGFYYPNDDERKAKFYGLLYKWGDALEACPKGWHLPSKKEFQELIDVAGATPEEQSENLRALGWSGTDALGFRALPAGSRGNSPYRFFGKLTYFWMAMEDNSGGFTNYLCLGGDGLCDGVINVNGGNRHSAFSVRCVKD